LVTAGSFRKSQCRGAGKKPVADEPVMMRVEDFGKAAWSPQAMERLLRRCPSP
jgi:hypothetical protein